MLQQQEEPSELMLDTPALKSPEVKPLDAFRFYFACKHALDFCVALGLSILFAPLIAVFALIVKLTSEGPVFYSQVRTGYNGQTFLIHKIRTMYHDCERLTGPRWSTENDPRITAIGHFLRKTHLDELPQIWNVLKGQMSLVGPRPERPEFVAELEKVFPRYLERLKVRPGLSGLAQVNLPPDVDQESVGRKLVHDLYYIENSSHLMDLKILTATALFLVGVPFTASVRIFGLYTYVDPLNPILTVKPDNRHRCHDAMNLERFASSRSSL